MGKIQVRLPNNEDPESIGILTEVELPEAEEVQFVRYTVTVNFNDVATEEYTSADTALTEDGAAGFFPVRARWYEALIELPVGSVIISAAVRIIEAWVSANATAVQASAMVRSAGFEHGVTDSWLSVAVRSEAADFVSGGADETAGSPLSGTLTGRACFRAVEIGIRVEFTNEGNVPIPGAPSAGSLELIVVAAQPA